jgi:hypothetical protein
MVVGFTTNFAISAYHYSNCEFESRSGEVYWIHYVIKFVSNLWQVSGFLQVLVSSTIKLAMLSEILLKLALNTIALTPKA